MNKFVFALLVLLPLSSLAQEPSMFNGERDGKWISAERSDEIINWYTLPKDLRTPTRIDFFSYEENGFRKSYYLLSRECENGEIEYYVIQPHHATGVGRGCSGRLDYAGWLFKMAVANSDPYPEQITSIIN